jgi:NAD(P)-dependent dehydrogenase (short-subunit alcohol dehydrogenase family)
MNTDNLSGATALVTGAASGIGRETALECARRGADLVVCDVNPEGLAATEKRIRELGREALACRVDVSSADEMRAFAERVHAERGGVDLLVNNAGVGLGAGFLDTSLEDWSWLLGIDLLGVVHGCHFFVPRMVERGRGGHVVNVSSAAGYVASSALCAYSTAKFGVLGLSEALREELAPDGIGVTAVCPGLINTAIVETSPMRGRSDSAQARSQIVDLYRRRNYTPERVARNLLKAVQRNRRVAPISPEAWALYYAKRWAPGLLVTFSRWVAARTSAGPRAR